MTYESLSYVRTIFQNMLTIFEKINDYLFNSNNTSK